MVDNLTAEKIAQSISSTPYSIPIDEITLPRLQRMAKQSQRIESRYREVRPKIDSVIRNSTANRAFETYHSNKLELKGPDLNHTQDLLQGIELDQADLRVFHASQAIRADKHLVDVLGIYQAQILVERIALGLTSHTPFTESDLRELNKFCIQEKAFAGIYRTSDMVNIGEFHDNGDPLWFSRPLTRPVEVKWNDIPIHMTELCKFVSQRHDCPPLAAAVAHAWFTHVHPFHDGNGRVARLLANLVLIRNDWPPIVIRHSEREDYLDALEVSDVAGDIHLLFELFLNYIDFGLSELERPEFFNKLFALELRGNQDLRHQQWLSIVREFLDELAFNLKEFRFRIERVSMPSLTTFTLLEERDPRAATLLAKLRSSDGREVRVGLGFMSNRLKDYAYIDPTFDGEHFAPTIYFQERNYYKGAEYPYVHRSDSSIRIREIAFRSKNEKQTVLLWGVNSPTAIDYEMTESARRLAVEIGNLQFPGFSLRTAGS